MCEHVPECSIGWFDEPCICAQLRECEKRVLNAAREAVAEADPYWRVETDEGEEFVMPVATALAAIDALVENK